ncbi:uncharacterized protein [Physcomitrium patens]|uniref:HMA domain-containing protein n=1 Tax=Physcomitrium patens TaxID=3218 RepID=A0A2K1L9N2_PHYPA|nr:uncharacterized protein LOC112281054 [Physcomitrium patens]PNR62740.1 hypothetical protein PHYPA_001164 [Physcomitrium patens]|eukprot:XP_024373020.1 uncharacterized protein LOC112281054 [Physcomitrella patens]
MAAAACQMMSLKVAQSPRVALDNQAMRGCKAALSSASLGCSRGVVYTLGARLRAVGGDSWGYKSSCCRKFVVSAAVAEPASAIQAESGAPAEGLSMHFKAEGSMNENSISKVTKALEGIEGVSQIKVYVEEGAATVELVKQTDIQATGVASSLVETIVQAGFKIQALSLGFDDDGGDDDEFIDYDPSSFSEEEEATAE